MAPVTALSPELQVPMRRGILITVERWTNTPLLCRTLATGYIYSTESPQVPLDHSVPLSKPKVFREHIVLSGMLAHLMQGLNSFAGEGEGSVESGSPDTGVRKLPDRYLLFRS